MFYRIAVVMYILLYLYFNIIFILLAYYPIILLSSTQVSYYSRTFLINLFCSYDNMCLGRSICTTQICKNGGTCVETANGLEITIQCACPQTHVGQRCESKNVLRVDGKNILY